jgi:hypothetical protein
MKNNSPNDHLTSYTDGVNFDINADGTRPRIGWTEARAQVGILALDRNNDGSINDGSELFGTTTRRPDGKVAANGFVALSDLDVNPRNGKIDVKDPAYAFLRLWFDDNHDGISQVSELVPLAQAGIVALNTSYRQMSRVDNNGNLYAWEGSATISDNGKEVTRRMFDVAFIAEDLTYLNAEPLR